MNPSFVAFNVVKALFLSRSIYLAALLATVGFLFSPASALAHHPFGGETPDTAVSGFLSGLAHPVIGFDHLVFVIASGLLAIIMRRGLFIPIAFAIASLMGTGIHLISLDLPAPEFFISASVLLFGVLLAVKHQPNTAVVIVLAAIAGLFHGYAYGEAIIGAEMAPLVAYLLGFALIQLVIALAAYWIGRAVLKNAAEHSRLSLRFAGFVICGVGATFVATSIMDTILPS
jgi:urease accessory protein